jgi:hypothetical protein
LLAVSRGSSFRGSLSSFTDHIVFPCFFPRQRGRNSIQHSTGYGVIKLDIEYVSYSVRNSTLQNLDDGVQDTETRVVSNDVMRGAHRITGHNMPIHNILSTAPQLSISQKTLGTLTEDGNVMPKHVGATIHN